MNERIKQLAEQAGFEITPWGNESVPCVHQEGPIDVELEKFAELIIRKCADIALQKGMASPDTDFRTGSYVINQYLLVHFGVEE